MFDHIASYIVRFRPPRIAMSLLGIATAIYLLDADRKIFSSVPLGGIVAVSGFALMISAWRLFKDRNIAICPTAETKEIISVGIYRYSRNPMYLGIVSMMMGVALMMGTASYYVVTVLFFLIMQFIFSPFEEAKLAKNFGEIYRDYAAATRRWL